MQEQRDRGAWAGILGIAWFVAGFVAVVVVQAADNQIEGTPIRHGALVDIIMAAWIVGLIVFTVIYVLAARNA